MDSKSSHFSAYDVLGYMVPGLALLSLVDFSVAYHWGGMELTYEAITNRYTSIPWKGAIALLLLSYYVGHMVSFVSAMTIERHARWFYTHPMEFLLARENKFPRYFDTGGASKCFSKLLRGAVGMMLIPIVFFEATLLKTGLVKNYIRHLSPELRAIAGKALDSLCERAKIYRDSSTSYPAEFELLAIHYTLESAPSHIQSLRNYVVLYGFLRSMTFVLVVFTWAAAIHIGFAIAIDFGLIEAIAAFSMVVLICGIFCTISYCAFLKFWTRYNKEALMGLSVIFLKEAAIEKAPNRPRAKKKPRQSKPDQTIEPNTE